MDITVYLPDAIGEQAKQAELNFSRMLRAAVEEELERRATTAATLEAAKTQELDLRTKEGRRYIGRIAGTVIAEGHELSVILTGDGRVLVHDKTSNSAERVNHPAEDLRDRLSEDEYIKALDSLGLKAVIDL